MTRKASDPVTISFEVVRGTQAGREFFVTMCPLETMCRITSYNDDTLPPEARAQRTLNRRRIPEITNYILDNPNSYVFSALTVSFDGRFSFHPKGENGYSGVLTVPASTQFIINDGQHRRAAISEALKHNGALKKESIPLVIFVGSDLSQSQQMFADLNRYAIRPSKSLGILYDRTDPLSTATLEIVSAVPLYRGRVEFEKTSLSNRSLKLFTLSNVYQAVGRFLGKGKGDTISRRDKERAIEYWSALSVIIPEWRALMKGETKPSLLRKLYVHSHGVVLVAMGSAGYHLLEQHPNDWKHSLTALSDVDWKRSNTSLWEGVAMEDGRISKAHRNVKRTIALLKKAMGLNLSDEEQELEFAKTDGGRESDK